MEKTNRDTYEERFQQMMSLDTEYLSYCLDLDIADALKSEVKLMALHYLQKCGLTICSQARDRFLERKNGQFGKLYACDIEKRVCQHIHRQFGLKAEFSSDWERLVLYVE